MEENYLDWSIGPPYKMVMGLHMNYKKKGYFFIFFIILIITNLLERLNKPFQYPYIYEVAAKEAFTFHG